MIFDVNLNAVEISEIFDSLFRRVASSQRNTRLAANSVSELFCTISKVSWCRVLITFEILTLYRHWQ